MKSHESPWPLWEAAANNVLAPLLAIPELYQTAVVSRLEPDHFPPGYWRDAYPAILDMRARKKEIVGVTLSAATKGQVPPEWIDLQMTRSDLLLVETFEDNITVLITQAQSERDILEYDQAVLDLRHGKPRHEVAARVISHISQDVDWGVQDASATAVANRIGDMLDSDPVRALTTGIPFVDRRTFGFQKSQVWYVVAHYKGWKSRLLRNMALAAARAGGSVTLGIFEGTQEMNALQIVAMLAAEYLYNRGLFHEIIDGPDGPERLALFNTLEMITLRRKIKDRWPRARLDALYAGLKAYDALGDRLRLYDKTKHNGRLTDLDSVLAMFLRDRHLYGSVDLLGLDYLQNIDADGKIFDQVSALAHGLQDMAMYYDTCVLVLSQMSEEAIKRQKDSHSPGAKGGGDPAQTADFLFTTTYDDSLADIDGHATLRLILKLARYARAGSDVMVELAVDPITGWILPGEAPGGPAVRETLDEQENILDIMRGMYQD